MNTLRTRLVRADFPIITVVLMLSVFSCIAIYAVELANGGSHSGWIKQMMLESVGFVIMLATMFFDFRIMRKVGWYIYGLTIVLLAAVFVIGKTINGAHSWIGLGSITFQPSELAKLAMVVVIANYMARVEESDSPSYGMNHFLPLVSIMLMPFVLTYLEPALGQAIVIFATFATMFVMFIKNSYFVLIFVFFVLFIGATVLIAVDYSNQAVHFINQVLVGHHILKSYQVDRIITWLNPSAQLQGSGFNVHMARIAIGSGETFGRGIMASSGVFVPNQTSDYVFSIIGQDFGFVGSAILIFLFLILVYRLIRIGRQTSDVFAMYYTVGITGIIGVQVFENVGMDLYMSPSTGITLPFVSAGGTSLWVFYFAIGLVLSAGIRSKEKITY
ncbi:FtsW/RodA/SpoVE family cell cycle protein [Alicyclobacillus sp. SO9]|uniref:FtsW/RodA/SpoVE family cell cycle protein n=1 Tax=Alicyclobacillus sp. SO9 TaxID=2665646 RepID=UPI0018E78E5C|nr:FtsW/RodA/SpoVE family cell cycle protein [Alicyclobacillus sp. SO9]QQE78636.1 rod shape-determining protein RodA [Alicyclobacillus sp. SO9]